MIKSKVIIAIVAVAMIGVMVPSGFAQQQGYTEKFYENMDIALNPSEDGDIHCTYTVRGCIATYNVQYEINAPNEYFYKSWMGESSSYQDIKNIQFTFSKITAANSFSYTSTINYKNGEFEIFKGKENIGFGSMFIRANTPINESLINEKFMIEYKKMNFAGMNRDVVYTKTIISEKTIAGFLDIEDNNYYDKETGILLKKEISRKVLDTSGQTNTDRYVLEISQINFPKNNDSGGGCLIATATYGSELAPQVQQLRELRDNQLLQTESGAAFMGTFNDIYYSFSPTIADMEREHPMFKEAVKVAITPMISSLSLMENAESESEVLGIGISVIALNLGMYLGIPAIVVIGVRKIR